MNAIINFINTPQSQSTGAIIFLLALALIIGSSMLALISELTHKTTAKENYHVLSHNITRSTWLWITVFSLIGGTAVFLPRAAAKMSPDSIMTVGISFGVSLLFFLLYHFTAKTIKIKALHIPLALVAAAAALTAAVFWFFPSLAGSLKNLGELPKTGSQITGDISQADIYCFIHFCLNTIAVSTLFFMLSNAREKENKRKQPREYYFKAASFAGSWLLIAVTLQILLSGWLLYLNNTANSLFTPPEVYWLAGISATALLGWLLLIKINKDGLVNYRATLIIAIFFIISLSLFHFGPLKTSLSPQAANQPAHTVKTRELSSQPPTNPQKTPTNTLDTSNPKQPER